MSRLMRSPLAILLVLAIGATPNAHAAERDSAELGQAICSLLPSSGVVIENSGVGCRWSALPDRPLLRGEVVELSVTQSTDEAARKSVVGDHRRYIDQMKQSHLFAKVTALNPCLQSGLEGNRIWIFHAQFTEMSGYAECNGQIISLKVYLDKNGGTGPTKVFDDLIQRVVPLLEPAGIAAAQN
ncbi:MAG: hypothetical protein ABL928_07910 [Sphingorhabdus sp.]